MIRKILEEICITAAGMMDTQPINLAGKEMPSKYEKQGKLKQKKAQLGYKYMKIRNKKDNIVENLIELLAQEGVSEEQIANVTSLLEDEKYNMMRGLLGHKSNNKETSKKLLPATTGQKKEEKKGAEIPDFLEKHEKLKKMEAEYAPIKAKRARREQGLDVLYGPKKVSEELKEELIAMVEALVFPKKADESGNVK